MLDVVFARLFVFENGSESHTWRCGRNAASGALKTASDKIELGKHRRIRSRAAWANIRSPGIGADRNCLKLGIGVLKGA